MTPTSRRQPGTTAGPAAARPRPSRARRAATAVTAAMMIAVAAGCSVTHGALAPGPAGTPPLPAPTGPPAHPACGGPVTLLGATQLRRVYGIPAMLAAHIDGTGTVIADIVPYTNPQVTRELAVYSRRYQLPPARLQVINYGHAGSGGTAGLAWTTEGTDDLEMMHALAPGATLVYVEVPGSSTADLIVRALTWVVARIHPDVVNYSLGTAEWPGAAASQAGLAAAARAGVTVTAGTGDTGPAEPMPGDRFLYPHPVPLWPASDPLVTAVGGTTLHLDSAGNRTRPDTVSSLSAAISASESRALGGVRPAPVAGRRRRRRG